MTALAGVRSMEVIYTLKKSSQQLGAVPYQQCSAVALAQPYTYTRGRDSNRQNSIESH